MVELVERHHAHLARSRRACIADGDCCKWTTDATHRLFDALRCAMPVKCAINGFGRIGRLTFRYLWDMPECTIVHVNEKLGGSETAACECTAARHSAQSIPRAGERASVVSRAATLAPLALRSPSCAAAHAGGSCCSAAATF